MTLPSWVGPTRTTPPSEQLPAAELRERPAQLAAPAVRREGGPDSLEPGAGPALPPAEPRCGLGGGERGGAFLPACKALPGAPRRMPLLPWPAVTRGVHSWRTGRRRRLPQRPLPAWLFFPGVVAGALSLSFCARAAGWHRPLLCPPGPGQESHLLWHHLLAHPPSHFRQSPQRNAILQDVSSGEPPFVLPVRSLST